MAVDPQQQSKRPEDRSAQSAPVIPVTTEAAQFGETLRQFVPCEGEDLTFDTAHGHEDWHRSLRYPG